jgi:hypothetical protein
MATKAAAIVQEPQLYPKIGEAEGCITDKIR